MTHKNLYIIILLILNISYLQAQKSFKVEIKETETLKEIYLLKDKKNNLIRELDSSKYYISFNGNKLVNFAIFGVKGEKGWSAIDRNENILFQVYNASLGEPNPDYLIENKIRIIDEKEKIGFADSEGKIIIIPQFEIVTTFHNGKAIIGEKCKKIPWGKHENEGDCEHYSIHCSRYGYINEKGEILKLGEYTFEEMAKEIHWKNTDE